MSINFVLKAAMFFAASSLLISYEIARWVTGPIHPFGGGYEGFVLLVTICPGIGLALVLVARRPHLTWAIVGGSWLLALGGFLTYGILHGVM